MGKKLGKGLKDRISDFVIAYFNVVFGDFSLTVLRQLMEREREKSERTEEQEGKSIKEEGEEEGKVKVKEEEKFQIPKKQNLASPSKHLMRQATSLNRLVNYLPSGASSELRFFLFRLRCFLGFGGGETLWNDETLGYSILHHVLKGRSVPVSASPNLIYHGEVFMRKGSRVCCFCCCFFFGRLFLTKKKLETKSLFNFS